MHQRILPRGLTVFAHTNPLYYLRGGAKVREVGSIAYLSKVRQGSHALAQHTGARFATAEEKEEALRLADEARRIYAKL